MSLDNPLFVLALHGFTGRGGDFCSITEKVQGQGVEVVALDLPGHDGVIATDTSFSLETAFERIEAVAPKTPFALMGYSLGGRIALHYAVRNPHRLSRLILIGAQPGLRDEAQRLSRSQADKALADHIMAIGVEAFLQEWAVHPLIKSQMNIQEPLKSLMAIGRKDHVAAGLARALVSYSPGVLPHLWERLSGIACPVSLMVGEYDAQYTQVAHEMKGLLPNAGLIIIPQAGHAAHLENEAVFVFNLLSFLK